MYRVVLYILIAIIGIAIILATFGQLSYSPAAIIFSTLFILVLSWATNIVFSRVFNAPTNPESTYITALILTLILPPVKVPTDMIFLGWASVLAIASKYIFALNKKHIFNPAAIAVVLTAFGFGGSANWWIGTASLAPFVAIGGYLIVRKIQREDMAFDFILTVFFLSAFFAFASGGTFWTTVNHVFLHSSMLFFAFIMLTEPLTTPPTRKLQTIYAILVGILFIPQIHAGSVYSTPELALVAGNIFSFLVTSKQKLIMTLKEKIQLGPDIVDYIFQPNQKFVFVPGQYMEWTLTHPGADSRGVRRYFTIASSPTENNIRLGIKFYPNGSSYKKSLQNLDIRTPIIGNQLAGDFTLPEDERKKLVFIAGGIGITPFRSMIKYLVDMKQIRDIVLFFANKRADEIVYKDVFVDAYQTLGIKTVYTLTDQASIPQGWTGKTGRIDSTMIIADVPDYIERTFYLSGPHAMVTGFEHTLLQMGVKGTQIKKDFFPGFV